MWRVGGLCVCLTLASGCAAPAEPVVATSVAVIDEGGPIEVTVERGFSSARWTRAGAVRVEGEAPGCGGWLSPTASARIRTVVPGALEVRVVGAGRVAALVGADGELRCLTSDGEGARGTFVPESGSTTELRVGTTVQGAVGAWSLEVSRPLVVSATSGDGSLPAVVESGDAPERLPDGAWQVLPTTGPLRERGHTIAERPAGEVSRGCAGHVGRLPSFRFEVATESLLTLRARSEEDIGLVVRGPGGSTWCIDDVEGLNPGLRHAFSPGPWTVYVSLPAVGRPAAWELTLSR